MQITRSVAAASAALLLGNLVPTPATASTTSSCWSAKRSERRFTRKMNAARTRAGRRPLRLDPQLSQVARKHTRAMSRRRDLFHSTRRQLATRVTNWTSLGENVGAGAGVRSLHRAFMRSTGHRRNIRGAVFRHVGVGVRRAHGRMWVTVIFESRADPGTTLPKPSC